MVTASVLVALAALAMQTPPPAPKWEIKAPSRLVLRYNRDATLLLLVSAGKVHRPRIAYAALQDASSGALLTARDLALCDSAGTDCAPPAELASPAVSTMRLRVAHFSTAGTFTGSVTLVADDTTELKAFDLTVLSSTNEIPGALLILAGILAWLVVNVWVRPWLARDEALIPAAQLLVVLEKLDRTLTGAEEGGGLEKGPLGIRFDDLRDEITTEIEKPTLRAFTSAQLDRMVAETNILAELIDRGVGGAMARLAANPRGRAAVAKAMAALNAKATEPGIAADAKTLVAGILAALDAEIAALPVVQRVDAEAGAAAPPAEVRVHRLERIAWKLTTTLWIFWAVVTWATGVVALVVTNDHFGTAEDLIFCFLWGLGVQAVGQSLQQLTPATIASSLKISTPVAGVPG